MVTYLSDGIKMVFGKEKCDTLLMRKEKPMSTRGFDMPHNKLLTANDR